MQDINIKKIRIYFFLIVLMLGLSHALSTRNSIDPDGVSYLDIASAYLSGDFKNAVSSYWSPLFSWVQSIALYFSKSNVDLEPTLVHVVNFFIFLFSYGCFTFLLNELILLNKDRDESLNNESLSLLPEWAWIIIGNSLFLWSATNLITISILTPDLLISGIVYLIFALLIKFKRDKENYLWYLMFGVVLGCGYLTKAFIFPLAFVFIFISALIINNKNISIPRLGLSLIIFILIAAPFVYVISKKEGHLTFGESGKLNYAWYVNDINGWQFWREGWEGNDELVHPAKRIHENPNVYEYAEPIAGTYPFWYDPTYWFKGMKPHFNVKGQLVVIRRGLGKFFNLYVNMQNVLLVYFFTLFYLSGRKKQFISDAKEVWFLLLPPLFVYFSYLMVAVELRYLGAFSTVLWLGILSIIKFKKSEELARFRSAITFILVMFLIITSSASKDILVNGKNDSAITQQQVSKGLQKMGLVKGDKVAVVGLSYGIYWARISEVKVVSEIDDLDEIDFWGASPYTKLKIYNKFRKLGVKMVVAEKAPEVAEKIGWRKIKGTTYYSYIL